MTLLVFTTYWEPYLMIPAVIGGVYVIAGQKKPLGASFLGGLTLLSISSILVFIPKGNPDYTGHYRDEIERVYGMELSDGQIEALKFPRKPPLFNEDRTFGITEVENPDADALSVSVPVRLLWRNQRLALVEESNGREFSRLEKSDEEIQAEIEDALDRREGDPALKFELGWY